MMRFDISPTHVTFTTSLGDQFNVPVGVLQDFAATKVEKWGQWSAEAITAIREAKSASTAFPALASAQRFARVLDAANQMSDVTMVGIQEDLDFYATNVRACAELVEEGDLYSAEILQRSMQMRERGESLRGAGAETLARQEAQNQAGSDVAAAEDEIEAAGGAPAEAPGGETSGSEPGESAGQGLDLGTPPAASGPAPSEPA